MRPSRSVLPIVILALAALVHGLPTLAHDEEPPKLLGRCTEQQLDEEPYSEWSRKEYAEYEPNPAILESLRKNSDERTTYKIYFGTWCGDSRREVPRLMKLLDAMGVADDRVELVALDRTAEALKQSPTGEERGREIYRVPTLILERDGKETSRMVEHPVLSLERDLLVMLSGDDYEPSYRAYPVIRGWLADGLLSDANVSPWGLASRIRDKVRGEGDLAAAARVMQSRGDLAEAIKTGKENVMQAGTMNVDRWVEVFRAIGLEDADMHKWHAEFEKRYPEGHQSFLEWLDLPAERIAGRRCSRRGCAT